MRLWLYALTGVRGFRLRLPDLKVRFTRKIRRSLWEDATGKGIRDPTAGIAIGRVMKQEKRKKKEVKKDVRIDRKLKNGQKV